MNAGIDVSGAVLRTERLILRPWREEDLEDMYAYASIDGVGQMAGWKPHENRQESQQILKDFIENRKTFAVECRGQVIGSIGVEEYREERFPELADKKCRELGFVLAKEYWGLGLMPEAAREVIRWLFEEAGLDAILCCHFRWNRQSRRVQEKCGFRYYADDRYETRMGTVEDSVVNLLTREQWTRLGAQEETGN